MTKEIEPSSGQDPGTDFFPQIHRVMIRPVISNPVQKGLHLVLFAFLLITGRVFGQDPIRVPFADLRAGQFNVGLEAVQNYTLPRAEKAYLEGYTDNSGLFHAPGTAAADAFMRDKTVPVVLGPDGYHLVDGHHRTTGNYLLSLKYSDFPNYLYVKQVDDLSKLSMDDFWKAMLAGDGRSSYIWLNNRGVPSSVNNLPFIPGLTDDSLRTFSSNIAADYMAYEILDPVFNFQEFYWADYLRDKVFLSGAGWENAGGNPNATFISSDYRAVATEAVRLCRLPEASNLPGFIAVPEPSEMALMAVVGMFFVVRGAWMRFKPGRA
jgi:hypothetical protein